MKKYMKDGIGIAVDLGSTTIAVCGRDEKRNEIFSFSYQNPQCQYGADVITRIQHCQTDAKMLDILRTIVWDSLLDELKGRLKEQFSQIRYIVISGNTTMQHIMRGLCVNGLCASPFLPVDLEYAQECLPDNSNCKILYPPGFSAFVGADILSGAYALALGKKACYDLLIDLGTNGELLLVNHENGYATSAACGPVFDHVIAGAKYGSESIHAIANCIQRNLIDENGLLVSPFFETGIRLDKNFVVRQEHIRNFQLAKGAVYAGIQCLLMQAKISYDAIGQVYISGGLGFYMNVKDAITVRMLPEQLKDRVTVVGNSSLEGAKKLVDYAFIGLTDNCKGLAEKSEIFGEFKQLKEKVTCFDMATLQEFQEIYMDALHF